MTSSDPNSPAALCQSSDYFDKKLVQGNLLVCVDELEAFTYGSATMAFVIDTARNLSAAGVIYVTNPDFDQVGQSPMLLTTHQLPSILISKDSEEFYTYYNESTTRGESPQTTIFGAKAKLNGGSQPAFTGASPIVASFSSRGPDFNNASLISYGSSTFLVPNTTFVPPYADVLKPNVMAPGVSIWAGWSPGGVASPTFQGQIFAIMSGTSMATPHIAGIAALVKERNPTFSPAAIHSALAGTAFSFDKSGAPLQAQYPSTNVNAGLELGPATAYVMGAGEVNALAALDPGLIFEAGIDDYIKFLCLTPTANSSQVLNATGSGCPQNLTGYPSDLNTPYISVGVLAGSRVVPRTVTSVSRAFESFTLHMDIPANVSGTVNPTSFVIAPGQSQQISVTLTALITSGSSSFGALHFYGNSSHNVTIPITVSLVSLP